MRPQSGVNCSRSDRPRRLPATYRRLHGVRHWLAFYDVHHKRLFASVRKRKSHQETLEALKLLPRQYPAEQRIHLILDNFSPHRKQAALDYCQQNNIHLIWMPTNASWLNPIECQFTQVKEFVIRGSNYRNHQELKTPLNKYVKYRNRKSQQK